MQLSSASGHRVGREGQRGVREGHALGIGDALHGLLHLRDDALEKLDALCQLPARLRNRIRQP